MTKQTRFLSISLFANDYPSAFEVAAEKERLERAAEEARRLAAEAVRFRDFNFRVLDIPFTPP